MIRSTFIILPHVGNVTERNLWKKGITTWGDFLCRTHIEGISDDRKSRMDERLEDADRFLEMGRSDYFCSLLPTIEQWRLFSTFVDDAAYLDIETDGIGPRAKTTVITVHSKKGTTTLIRGIDLTSEGLAKALAGAKMLVTFNGSSFDIPVLNKEFPFTVPRVPHFDLRHGAHRIGHVGGLKLLEERFGIKRPQEVAYVTGEEAVYLWRLWEKQGKKNALRLLVRYNREDTVNLEKIAGIVYDKLVEKTWRE